MSGEDMLWKYVKERLVPYCRLTRIENSCEDGTPDVCYTVRPMPSLNLHTATTGWIELKHIPAWPVRSETTVHISGLKLSQVQWLEDEERVGGRAWCLLQAGRSYLLLNAGATRGIYERKMRVKDLWAAASVGWQAGRFPLKRICLALAA